MGNIIIGIHGLSNKPAPNVLEKGWHAAMLKGLKKNANISLSSLNFSSVYWADVMYPTYDDKPDLYREAGEGDLKRYEDGWLDSFRATAQDLADNVIDSFKTRFGIDALAEAVLKSKLKDLYKYYEKKKIRDELRSRLRKEIIANKNKRIMVIAHSMGSIVAYDVLRELGRSDPNFSIEHFVTIGSPLGLPHVKYKIHQENHLVRTPSNVKKWSNLADKRDPVALDTHLSDDFKPNDFDVQVRDNLVLNDWGGTNHKSYGYLRTPEFTDILKRFI